MATSSHHYVQLTLDNLMVPDHELQNTPSRKDGIDTETEMDLRIGGCEMIQLAGKLLRLPQVAMATAQTLFQRFYYRKSFVGHDFTHVAMACIFLAAKIEESPRRSSQVLNVFHHIVQRRAGKPETPLNPERASYSDLKNFVIKAERRVLKELGFNVHIQHPHKLIINYLALLGLDEHETLPQRAWNYMNDSFRTNVFCRFQPPTIASATIWLAARDCGVRMPDRWWEVFDADLSDMEIIASATLALYTRPQRSKDELDQLVASKLHAKQARLKELANKPMVHPTTPASMPPGSPVASGNGTEDEKPKTSEKKDDGEKRDVQRTASTDSVSSRRSRSATPPRTDKERERGGGKDSDKEKERSRSRSRSPSRDRDRDRGGRRDDRSRSPLGGRHIRESSQSNRDRERDRDRDRDRERDRRDGRERDRRDHRDRSRERERERERDRERERERDRHGRRDRRY